MDHAVGVRVLAGNGWGFASTSDARNHEALEITAQRALSLARASHLIGSPISFPDSDAVSASWASSYLIDPWSISLEMKIEYLLAAIEPIGTDPRIHQAVGEISSYRQQKLFVSSAGSIIHQTATEMGGGIEAHAMAGNDYQRRTYPNPFGGDYQARGWEFIEGLDLRGNASRIRDEAIALLDAPKAPAGTFDLVIGSSQLALQVHESCGHAAELDRALGYEVSLAGGSFLDPSMLGTFHYGSPGVTIVADATIAGSIGSFGFDDEGNKAQRFPLVERGIFVDFLTGRESAARIGRDASNATVRAESASRLPLIRMTNINLEPGTASLDEIIASTRNGIFIDTNKSWSIDDRRLNFQFGCEVGFAIENGRLGRLLKNPVYGGSTPSFWRSCDLVGDRASWQLWGLPNCGKGEPLQTMRVAHGAPAARFLGVEMR